MKKGIKIALVLLLCTAVFTTFIGLRRGLPDTIYIERGGEFSYRRGLLTIDEGKDETARAAAALSGGGSYAAEIKLFDIIPVKRVMVNVVERKELYPMGIPFGVKMFTEGVIVVGFGDIKTANGDICPAQEAGIRLGDNILSIKGIPVGGNSELAALVKANGERPMEVLLERNGNRQTLFITPAAARDGTGYKVGMWVRDSTAGIGTATYYDENSGIIAGLGHAIADSDTGVVMPVSEGELVSATIVGVIKGAEGAPGELKGVISGEDFAELLYNGETGIFAAAYVPAIPENTALQIAFKQEVAEGEAQILTTVNGSEPQYYSCVIEKAYLNSSRETQNMVIRITDSRLLNLTGGIVQGMSGSPIIQNGRLVGAVTHVFVNDPTRGYGIFIENMLATQNEVAAENQLEKAA